MLLDKKRFYLPIEIKFGKGVAVEISGLVKSTDKVFVVTDSGIEKAGITGKIIENIEKTGAVTAIFNKVTPNPTSELAAEALEELKKFSATAVVAVGGGSPLDLGKIIAALATNDGRLEDYQWNGKPFENDSLPFIAVPTTAGTGSEVTRVAVIVDRNVKKGVNSDKLFPKYAIIDPELMTGLPSALTASTGMDALTHAVEAYVGLNSNPFTDSLALEAVRLIGKSLWKACACGSDLEARYDMALASTLAGIAMDQAGLGIVHSMSGPLCSYFHLSHGDSNAALLKYGMRFNLMAAPEKFAKLAESLGYSVTGMDVWEAAMSSVHAVTKLLKETGLKIDLQAYGLKEADADLIAEETLKMFLLKNNPRKPSLSECKQLYLDILGGVLD